MIDSPSTAAIPETVDAVVARLREWIGLQIPGIVWVRYVSDASLASALERLSFGSVVEQIEFNPPAPAQAADWLEEQLRKVEPREPLPVVAVLFSPLLQNGRDGFAAALRSLNLRREVIARSPLIQLWWVPASAAPTAEAEALDLASWFQVRMTLSETAAQPDLDRAEIERTSSSQESLKRLEDVVLRQRRLVTSDALSYSPQLAVALEKLAERYFERQRLDAAEDAFQEALSIWRRLSEANPGAYLAEVADTLLNLATLRRTANRMLEAEGFYKEALSILRNLAEANPDAYLPDLAKALNHLASLYRRTLRMDEAEKFYNEALAIRRRLADANPDAYLSTVAGTLNNLAFVYRGMQRMKEAETSHREALSIFRRLAEADSDAHSGPIAATLGNLGDLYKDMNRTEDAEISYREALSIWRRLAESDPDDYLPNVARTLSDLAILYSYTNRSKEALELCRQAERILEPLWQRQPETYGNRMAAIFLVRAPLEKPSPTGVACEYAHRAFAAASAPHIKEAAQKLIDQLCSPPS